MPALLRTLSDQELTKYRTSTIPAMALTFSNGGPCLGVFCAMIVSLLSPQNLHPCAWELAKKDSITPSCLYGNCVKFVIPKSTSSREQKYPATVVLIDAFTHFEIHVNLPESATDLETKLCPLIRKAVYQANHCANVALHYNIPKPRVCLVCPCKLGESHPAEIDEEDGYLVCIKDLQKSVKLMPQHKKWCEAEHLPPCDTGMVTYAH